MTPRIGTQGKEKFMASEGWIFRTLGPSYPFRWKVTYWDWKEEIKNKKNILRTEREGDGVLPLELTFSLICRLHVLKPVQQGHGGTWSAAGREAGRGSSCDSHAALATRREEAGTLGVAVGPGRDQSFHLPEPQPPPHPWQEMVAQNNLKSSCQD